MLQKIWNHYLQNIEYQAQINNKICEYTMETNLFYPINYAFLTDYISQKWIIVVNKDSLETNTEYLPWSACQQR